MQGRARGRACACARVCVYDGYHAQGSPQIARDLVRRRNLQTQQVSERTMSQKAREQAHGGLMESFCRTGARGLGLSDPGLQVPSAFPAGARTVRETRRSAGDRASLSLLPQPGEGASSPPRPTCVACRCGLRGEEEEEGLAGAAPPQCRQQQQRGR